MKINWVHTEPARLNPNPLHILKIKINRIYWAVFVRFLRRWVFIYINKMIIKQLSFAWFKSVLHFLKVATAYYLLCVFWTHYCNSWVFFSSCSHCFSMRLFFRVGTKTVLLWRMKSISLLHIISINLLLTTKGFHYPASESHMDVLERKKRGAYRWKRMERRDTRKDRNIYGIEERMCFISGRALDWVKQSA